MEYSILQLSNFCDNFLHELTDASKGIKNSLLFAKNPLPKTSFVDDNQEFLSLVVGGSNLASSKVKIVNNRVVLGKVHQQALPKLETKEIFLEILSDIIDPEIRLITLNFAYPITPIFRDDKVDGILIRGPKEHNFVGLIGQQVGQVIEQHLLDIRGQKVDVLVVNDTVGLGLASRQITGFDWQNTLVGVVGTGTNFGFYQNKDIFINLESGNFDKFSQSDTGKIIDTNSSNPGQQWFEKEAGGAYLVKHFNLICKQKGISLELETTEQMSQLLQQSSDKQTAEIVADIFDRSASLIAMQIFAIYKFKIASGVIIDTQKVMILLEGSLYWHGFGYKSKVDFYLNKLGLNKDNYQIHHLKNAGLVGVAGLAII